MDTQVDEYTPEEEAAPVRRKRAWWVKLLIGLGVFVLVVAVVGLALYEFGGMGRSEYDPAIKQQYAQLVAAGQVPPVQKQFVIPIPGCTCHSTDPVLTEQHRYYRMNGCMVSGCHGQ